MTEGINMAESFKAPIDALVSPGSRDKLRTQDIDSLSQDPLRAIKESYRASFFETEGFQEGERLAEVLAVDIAVKLPSDLNYFGNTSVANQYGTRTWISAICRLIDQDGAVPDPDQTYESPDGTTITIPFKETTRLRANVGKFYAPLEDIQGKGALNIQVGDWLVVEYQDKLLRNNGVIKDVYLKKDLSTWQQIGGGDGGGDESGLTITGQPIVGCPNGPALSGDLATQFGPLNAAAIFGEDPFCYSNNIGASQCEGRFDPPCSDLSSHKNVFTNPEVMKWMKEVIRLTPEVPPAIIAAISIHEGGAKYIKEGGNTGYHLNGSGLVSARKPRSSKIKGKTYDNWHTIPEKGWSATCTSKYCNYGFGPVQIDATAHDIYAMFEEIGTWNPNDPLWTSKVIKKVFLSAWNRAKGKGLSESAAAAVAMSYYNGGEGGKEQRFLNFKNNNDLANAWAAIDRKTCGGSYGTGAFVIARMIACAAATDSDLAYLKG
jgi:hypothetical protein